MLSRKQFFKDLLFRGIRAASDLTAGGGDVSPEYGESRPGSNLPATELSPSLLAIEAECRGAGGADELRSEIYRELAQNHPPITLPSPPLPKKGG
jgi:hypothetical protein